MPSISGSGAVFFMAAIVTEFQTACFAATIRAVFDNGFGTGAAGMSQEKRRIFVLYTGGTIGMVQSGRGLRPDAALAEKALLPFSDGLSFDCIMLARTMANSPASGRSAYMLMKESSL